MKIQNNLHMMSTFLLLVFAVSTLVAGSLVITNVVYRLNAQLLDLRLGSIIKEIESIHEILVRAGLDDVPKYNKSAQDQVVKEIRDYQFGQTGMVMIVDAAKVELLEGIFDLDFLAEMERRERGSLEYDYFGEPRYGIFQSFEPWDWTISLSITKKEMFSVRSQYIQVVSMVTILLLSVSITIAFIFSRRLTQSIQYILNGLKRIEDGDTTVRLEPETVINEIIDLNSGINSMTSKIDRRTMELVSSNEENLEILKALHDEEILHREARISALQSQINPHFLYNTLECISSIALAYNAVEIQEIVISLSHMFKYAVRKDSVVKILDEITSVQSYLNVQKIRFADKIQATIELPEDLLGLNMMKFIIQPIVENSIYHGLEPKVGEGHISITGSSSTDTVIIVVQDDGIGMSSDFLESLLIHINTDSAIGGNESLDSRGIGLLNIHNRIVLSYGEPYGLKIQSEIGSGTSVTITLPIIV